MGNDWKLCRLEEVSEKIDYGYTESAAKERVGPKFLRITDIQNGIVDWSTVPFCPINQKKHEKYKLHHGDIVVARTGNSTGENYLFLGRTDAVFASYLIRYRINKSIADPYYVWYTMRTPDWWSYIHASKTGSAQAGANAKVIGGYTFPLPPLPEQQRIASILSAYDHLIENNKRRIQLLEQAARLLYREWFVHLRFPGHEHVKIVDGVPEGWERKTLGEVADIIMGQSPKSKFYNDNGEGLPFHQGVTNFTERYPKHHTYCTVKKRIAEPFDILFSVRAPVGRINIAPDQLILGRGLAAIRAIGKYQNFLFYALKEMFFRDDLMGGGSIFAAITKKDLHNVTVIIASEGIVDSFQEQVESIDSQIRILDQSIAKLTQARDLLLPRLMNGEIEV